MLFRDKSNTQISILIHPHRGTKTVARKPIPRIAPAQDRLPAAVKPITVAQVAGNEIK